MNKRAPRTLRDRIMSCNIAVVVKRRLGKGIVLRSSSLLQFQRRVHSWMSALIVWIRIIAVPIWLIFLTNSGSDMVCGQIGKSGFGDHDG